MQITQNKTPEAELNALYDEFHKLPIQRNKIVCDNFHGLGYGCNPKYIVEALLSLGKNLDIVWLTNGEAELPRGVRVVPYHSEEAIREIATAQVLIDNVMKFHGFKKRPDQYYIQTWHGDLPLKKIGFDNPANVGSGKYSKRVSINFKNTDLVITGSRFSTEMFRRSFHYEGEILECGMPRDGVLLHTPTSLREDVCKYYHVSVDKKILLYAPTYRDKGNMTQFTLDYQRVLDQLGDEYVMLLRLHPRMAKYAKSLTYTNRLINASDYPDMQELMAVSDIMITDYSAVMFNFAMTGRPVYLFATDVEEYRKQRDYYFDIYDLPFPLATTTENLIQNLLSVDIDTYEKKLDQFWDEIGLRKNSNAAQLIANLIVKMTHKKNFDIKLEVQKIVAGGDRVSKVENILKALLRKLHF